MKTKDEVFDEYIKSYQKRQEKLKILREGIKIKNRKLQLWKEHAFSELEKQAEELEKLQLRYFSPSNLNIIKTTIRNWIKSDKIHRTNYALSLLYKSRFGEVAEDYAYNFIISGKYEEARLIYDSLDRQYCDSYDMTLDFKFMCNKIYELLNNYINKYNITDFTDFHFSITGVSDLSANLVIASDNEIPEQTSIEYPEKMEEIDNGKSYLEIL